MAHLFGVPRFFMDDILVGKIVTCVGIKGEVKVYNYSDKDRFKDLKHIYINNIEYFITKARIDGNTAILKLKGIDDRNTAETLVNFDCFIKKEDLRKLEEDTYYIFDLKGMDIISNEKKIGTVKDVLQGLPQDNLEIELENGNTFLLPFVKAFILEVNTMDRFIRINLIPGFIDDAIEI